MQENNHILIIFAIIITIVSLIICLVTSIIFFYQKKHNAFVTQVEHIKSKYEKEILKSKLEVQEQTLQHISRELHDNIGQFITLAKVHLNTVVLSESDQNANKIAYAVELLTKALQDLRDTSKSLSLELINSAGLVMAIESQIDQIQKTDGYTIEFEIVGTYEYLDEQKEIILFRILQEALNNIIKHAETRFIRIVLECRPEEVQLFIIDHGKGFEADRLIKEGKTYNHNGGLSNMIARAGLINAEFNIESSPNNGTTIKITTPIYHERTEN